MRVVRTPKDVYGNELVEGDTVVFVTSGYCHRSSIARGVFTGISPCGGFKITAEYSHGGTRKTTLQRNKVVKITPAAPPTQPWQWLGTHETSSSR